MAKTDGYSKYACDRCGKSAYIADGATESQQWRQVTRISADYGESKRLLCPECSSAYFEFARKQDSAFDEFMRKEAV